MEQVRTNQSFSKYIFLSVVGMLGSSGTILADTFFVANRLGANGLAALNIAIAIFGLMNGIGMMFGLGGATQYAIHTARGCSHEANRTFTLAFGAALVVGSGIALLGLTCSDGLARLLGANETILPMCSIYLKTVMAFAPCFILNHLFMAFIRNDQQPRLAAAAMLAGSIANIILDYLFLYPCNLGIFGAAFATGLAPLIGLSISSLHLIKGCNHFHFTAAGFHLRELRSLSGLGLSAFVNELSSGVVLVVFNLLILRAAGNIGVAAYGIIANLALVVLAVFTGISLGLQPLVSRAHGQRDGEAVRGLYRKGLLLSFVVGAAVCLIAVLFAPTLVAWFNSEGDATLQAIAEQGLRLYFIGFLFVGHNLLTAALLGAVERPKSAFGISFFRGFAGILMVVSLLSVWLGMTGIWLAFPVVECLTLLLGRALMQREQQAMAPHFEAEGQQPKAACISAFE